MSDMPMLPEQSNSDLLDRQAGDDVSVVVTLRLSAFRRLTSGGLPVNGIMQLVPERAGGYSVCIWSREMPDWPDPVPGNAVAAHERDSAASGEIERGVSG